MKGRREGGTHTLAQSADLTTPTRGVPENSFPFSIYQVEKKLKESTPYRTLDAHFVTTPPTSVAKIKTQFEYSFCRTI